MDLSFSFLLLTSTKLEATHFCLINHNVIQKHGIISFSYATAMTIVAKECYDI